MRGNAGCENEFQNRKRLVCCRRPEAETVDIPTAMGDQDPGKKIPKECTPIVPRKIQRLSLVLKTVKAINESKPARRTAIIHRLSHCFKRAVAKSRIAVKVARICNARRGQYGVASNSKRS
jgi:hypothetical protein